MIGPGIFDEDVFVGVYIQSFTLRLLFTELVEDASNENCCLELVLPLLF